jgi:long-chain acyl-CoA synthetase
LVTVGASEAVEWARQQKSIDDDAADKHIKDLTENPLGRSDELQALLERVSRDPEVQQRIVASVKRANEGLSRVETIKKICVLDREFSVEEDELTPTLKLKRKNIEAKFTKTFDQLYDDEAFGLVVLTA